MTTAIQQWLGDAPIWYRVTKFSERAVEIADGIGFDGVPHYSRQSPGSDQILPPGETLLLVTGEQSATWGAVHNMPPHSTEKRWRCSIFSNRGGATVIVSRRYRHDDHARLLATRLWLASRTAHHGDRSSEDAQEERPRQVLSESRLGAVGLGSRAARPDCTGRASTGEPARSGARRAEGAQAMTTYPSRKRWEQSPQGLDADRRKKQNKRNEIKAAINALKNRPCMDCGQTFDPVCMDFDHRDPSTKRKSVAWMIAHGLKAVLDEIEKCDLVCANCHRLRTHRSRDHKNVCAIARERKPEPYTAQLPLIAPGNRRSE